MLPDRVSNPGPLTYESGALPIALRGPASAYVNVQKTLIFALVKGDSMDPFRPDTGSPGRDGSIVPSYTTNML